MCKIKGILISIFALLIIVIIFFIINPVKRYRKYQIEAQLLSALTEGVISEDISNDFEREYTFAIREDTNTYRIDDFIKYYINLLDTCILIKKDKATEDAIKEFFVKGDHIDLTVTRCNDSRFARYIVDNMTEKDIELYDNHQYIDYVLNKLETKIIHKSNNKYEDWYLIGNDSKEIELLYNYYIKYVPNNKRNLKDLDRIIDFKIVAPISKIDRFDSKNNTIKSKIKYITKTGENKEMSRVVLLENINDKLYYSPSVYLSSLFYNQTVNPTITTGQHDYDEAVKKEQEELNEFLDYVGGFPGQSENIDTREIVKSTELDVPKFIKYNAKAVVTIYEYDDGSIEYRFKAVKTVDDKGSMSVKNYLLPYKNVKDVEDLLSQYLADGKRYNNDEKWLKENNYLYKEN